jgi:hypothetical protein
LPPACPTATCWLIAAGIIAINASTAFETLTPFLPQAWWLHLGALGASASAAAPCQADIRYCCMPPVQWVFLVVLHSRCWLLNAAGPPALAAFPGLQFSGL